MSDTTKKTTEVKPVQKVKKIPMKQITKNKPINPFIVAIFIFIGLGLIYFGGSFLIGEYNKNKNDNITPTELIEKARAEGVLDGKRQEALDIFLNNPTYQFQEDKETGKIIMWERLREIVPKNGVNTGTNETVPNSRH